MQSPSKLHSAACRATTFAISANAAILACMHESAAGPPSARSSALVEASFPSVTRSDDVPHESPVQSAMSATARDDVVLS